MSDWDPPVPFIVTRNPDANHFVSFVQLTADVPVGDANPSNNSGAWNFVTNK